MPALRPLAQPDTAPLFPLLHAELLALLRALEPADWERPTVAGTWSVRDVAAHLFDGELRTLAAHRDGHRLSTDGPVSSYADVVALVQRLNVGGVDFGRRLSPELLTDLLEVTGRWMSAFVATLDPDAPALFAVAWAGETQSSNRFDTAREYTERWHHQMQIRMAVGDRGNPSVLLAHRYLVPLLDTAVRVLPHAYREVAAPEGTALVVRVHDALPEQLARDEAPPGASPLVWTLRREEGRWQIYGGEPPHAAAHVTGTADAVWRLLFNALAPEQASEMFTARGPSELVTPLWRARSVMV
jgi:uncharacterized protein (TIGR03083 family)